MSGRIVHLTADGVSLVVALDGVSAAIRHFGAGLDLASAAALAGAAPPVRWGARWDAPRPPQLLPHRGAGDPSHPALPGDVLWTLADAEQTGDALALTYASGAGHLDLRLTMLPGGVLQVRSGAAVTLPLPDTFTETLTFGGDWAAEFRAARIALPQGRWVKESRRGRPGHDAYPGLVLGEPGFGEDHGRVVALALAWSGDHAVAAERTREGPVLAQLEAYGAESEAFAVWSDRGLNGAMERLDVAMRAHILRPRTALRPVHLNTWEAIYFAHDGDALIALADKAAALGIERFVLDDGWFRNRTGDRAGLGDWTPDPVKYPEGLGPLIDHVRARGMTFGLWVEPEMVNEDSDLARAHPEWILRHPDRTPVLMRHQLMLDLGRADVQAHVGEAVAALLRAHPIAYLKWDMNRDLTEPADGAAYVRGLYAVMDRLRSEHPEVEIETCASGGGRCDLGILRRADRVWVSDSNDALDRLNIQRAAAQWMPLSIMGAHVGPERCHITGRTLPLDLRAHVALFGHMGLELDVRVLSDADAARLAAHIATYKAWRALIHGGRYARLETFEPDHAADWVTDGARALVRVVRTGSRQLGQGVRVRLPGLDPARTYAIGVEGPVTGSVAACLAPALKDGALRLSGRALAAHGLELFLPRPETSVLIALRG